jgi:hypothetical protein
MTELNKKAFESQLTLLNGRLRETADTSNAFLGKFLFSAAKRSNQETLPRRLALRVSSLHQRLVGYRSDGASCPNTAQAASMRPAPSRIGSARLRQGGGG